MDISNKIKVLQQEVDNLSAEKKLVVKRIAELRSLAERKKLELLDLASARSEELKLMKELGIS